MTYLIVQDWSNTSNNHAGIKYLCTTIQNMYPERYITKVIPSFNDCFKISKYEIIRRFQTYKMKWNHHNYTQRIYRELQTVLKDDDKVIIMEYMDISLPMLSFAQKLKKDKPNVILYAMVHLVPQKLDRNFSNSEILHQWLIPIDKILTLGSSLTNYFISRGINKNKIFTTFHYADKYYQNPNVYRNNPHIKVIAMGNQMRNKDLLKNIVTNSPNVEFIICQGVSDMSADFSNQRNVTLIPFVPEETLRQYMKDADISLNVMYDTIGSNVIVTSLAMGLAMICSNVGSIHDYCNETNTIFCENSNINGFSEAIAKLQSNRMLLQSMQKSSAQRGKELSIKTFVEQIENN